MRCVLNEPPANFGDWYDCVGELGRGTTGTVYKARDTKLNRQVAIKVPDRSLDTAKPLKPQWFIRECQILAGLTQETDCNIPKLHAVTEFEGQIFCVRDFVDGHTLAQRVADGPIDLRTGLSVLASVAQVVQFVHDHGISHQNLSPENILVAGDGTPWLIGFGRARAIDDILLSSPVSPVEFDVQSLLDLLKWLTTGLGYPLPDGLDRAATENSTLTAGGLGEMLISHL